MPVFNLMSLSCNVWENSKLKLILWLLKSSWAISFNFDDCSWAWDGSTPVTKCIFWIFEHLRITSSQSLKKFTIWWWALYQFWQFLDFYSLQMRKIESRSKINKAKLFQEATKTRPHFSLPGNNTGSNWPGILNRLRSSMLLRHETSLMRTPLPFWTALLP